VVHLSGSTQAFIMKIKSNTTNKDLPWRFGLYQRPSSEENGTNSSSGSCHGGDVMWQEICHTCGSVWWRPKRQGKSLLVVFDLIFIINVLPT